MTGWVNYEQKEYAIAFDADRRCVYPVSYTHLDDMEMFNPQKTVKQILGGKE